MTPFLDWLIEIAVFPGLSIAALGIGGWLLLRRDNLRAFAILNVAVIILVGILALLQPSDPHAPVPGMIVVIYMIFYVPAHLLLMGLLILMRRFLNRRRAEDAGAPEDVD